MKIYEAAELLEKNKISPRELKKEVFDNIKQKNSKLNGYITICEDGEAVKSSSPLYAIPVSIKDNICTKGILTTAGSKMLSDFVPPYDATVAESLKNIGAVIIGKANMDEFGMGAEGAYSYFGEMSNPVNPLYIPGGSSGGSCISVKSGMALGSLGTDTGGSIRQPASFCGLYGLKPTYSLVSRYGLISFASSLDCIGPICQSAKDCAIMLDAISGADDKDATCSKREKERYLKNLTPKAKGIKIGIPKEFFENVSDDVKENVFSAVKNYTLMGAEVEECSIKSLKYAVSAYYIISSAEASSNLARYDGVRFGCRSENYTDLEQMYINTRSENFGEEVKRRILLGSFVLSEGYRKNYYEKAKKAQTLLKNDFRLLFETYDALITPVSPVGAWKKGEKHKIDSLYSLDACTASVSLAGLPAISIPAGVDKNGLPVGFQLIGKSFSEQMILNLAWAYEEGGFYNGI